MDKLSYKLRKTDNHFIRFIYENYMKISYELNLIKKIAICFNYSLRTIIEFSASICFIFPLCIELKALAKSTNNMVACRFLHVQIVVDS